jgi:hypothetical protein
MPTANRFAQRYTTHTRTCSTEGCSGTAKGISTRCHTCVAHLRRFGDCLQTLPSTAELDKYVRRLEEARGRLKTLDLAALEARWTVLVDDCRAKATPTFKDRNVLSYNGYEREASQLIRDISEAIPFTRALDLLGAIQLMAIERPGFFKSEEALACSTVELMRRTSRVNCKVVAMNNANGTISTSYRREMSRNSRLACAKMLNVGLGAAAVALAKREAKRADREQETRASYYDAVRAIEATA